ncbi:MAG: RNA polymerase factor sigma-54 [Francisellaceae bacterium]|jgi:RNA polymerase sigma-54 factor|nr:RNA polymerase factor sigma-54 [Francisellaceae bacterium]MBT6208343.1 RNA polymerase factor sigma-54 [Francisellaceae bacterium]
MKPSLALNIGQSLNITPQLQQAIKLLQLSSLEIESTVQEMLDSNTMLEPDSDSEVQENKNTDHDLDAFWDKHGWSSLSGKKPSYDNNFNLLENYSEDRVDLQSHLRWQLNFCKWSDQKLEIANAIICNLKEDGYLEASIEEICNFLPAPIADASLIADTLYEIQRLDPVGIGARTLEECLLIQLETMPKYTHLLTEARLTISNYLNILAHKNYKKLKSKLQINDKQLQELIDLLSKLKLKPGHLINDQKSEYIIPDLSIIKHNGCWEVVLNKEINTRVRVNPSYAALVKRSNSSRDNVFLQEQLREARWFLKSLHNRNDTILKVAKSIIKKQNKFLTNGPDSIVPLILSDIALDTSLHESTVSRVTTNKYIHTPQGMFELKYFFSSHVNTVDGAECSSTAIRAMIKKLIYDENRTKPLSDQAISETLMGKQHIKIARRTVAKYREMLGIPPSNLRKIIQKS